MCVQAHTHRLQKSIILLPPCPTGTAHNDSENFFFLQELFIYIYFFKSTLYFSFLEIYFLLKKRHTERKKKKKRLQAPPRLLIPYHFRKLPGRHTATGKKKKKKERKNTHAHRALQGNTEGEKKGCFSASENSSSQACEIITSCRFQGFLVLLWYEFCVFL